MEDSMCVTDTPSADTHMLSHTRAHTGGSLTSGADGHLKHKTLASSHYRPKSVGLVQFTEA